MRLQQIEEGANQMKLDPRNPLPLHVQLKKSIVHSINKGYYQDKIPSERELTEQYEISRTTVREAVSQLVQEGILEKKHGKGTFISIKPIHDWLGHLSSTSETVSKMGMKPGAKLLKHGIVPSPFPVKSITEEKEMYLIKRIRYADEIPLAIETHYYPVSIGQKLAKLDIESGTIYDLLENELQLQLSEADQIITSSRLKEEDAVLLGIDKAENTLQTERFLTDSDGCLIEYYTANYRADMYSFHIKLSR